MDRKTLYSDVDETLICHDLSDFPADQRITIRCNGRSFQAVPHEANIRLLIKFYKLGYEIIVWSKTGKSWAKAVVKKLGLEKYVEHCLSKPDWILDDKASEDWMGARVYRDAKTGKEA